jgi:hypothetical protein
MNNSVTDVALTLSEIDILLKLLNQTSVTGVETFRVITALADKLLIAGESLSIKNSPEEL